MQRLTSFIISMNTWASCPERFLIVLTSLPSEKIDVIRETRSSMVRVSLISLCQAGEFERSTVSQKRFDGLSYKQV